MTPADVADISTSIHPGHRDRGQIGRVHKTDGPHWRVDAYSIAIISGDADVLRALADMVDPVTTDWRAEIAGCSVISYSSGVTFRAGPFYAAIYRRDRAAVAAGLRAAADQADMAREAVSA